MANHNPADKVELIDMGAPDGKDEPKVVEMTATDANHAIAVDPERYHLPTAFAPPPTTLEQRVAALEQRVEKLDSHHKKLTEARAAEHKRLMSERRKSPAAGTKPRPPTRPEMPPPTADAAARLAYENAEKQYVKDLEAYRVAEAKYEKDRQATATKPAAPVTVETAKPASTQATNPNWPAAPPADAPQD